MTLDYLGLLVSKYLGDMVSVRFLMFSLVGASGVLVHLVALRASCWRWSWTSIRPRLPRPSSP